MFDIEAADDMVLVVTFTLSLLSANLLLFRRSHKQVYGWLATFFIANAFTELPSIIELVLVESGEPSRLVYVLMALTLPILLAMPPLLWFYVRAITSESGLVTMRQAVIHFLPAVAGLSLTIVLLAVPWRELSAAATAPNPISVPLIFNLHLYLMAFILVFIMQCGFYAVLVTRRLISYRKKLRDLFSSTEDREMRWAGWLGIFMGGYVVSSFITHFSVAEMVLGYKEVENHLDPLPNLFSLMFLWTLSLWGLRQKPGLIAEDTEAADHRDELAATGKYERSALSDDHARRIAKKIENAMRETQLYRDPNLSLWALSKAIRVSPNYVSQTLNATMGHTFFDYVNNWRIAEAKDKLARTSDTISAITYDVGFNSRSSFYTAFKRDTGQTPNQYRQSGKTDSTISQVV